MNTPFSFSGEWNAAKSIRATVGYAGRCLRYVAGDEADARKLVQRSLRLRATAKKRIGVSYRFRELIDPRQWAKIYAEEHGLANA